MNNHSKMLIYDDDCPLCSFYTSAFVKTGMLSEEGRKSFRQAGDSYFALIERPRCNNEIPLIDIETKQVWYGIDALLEIMDSRIPCIKSIANIQPLKWVLQKTYKIISYNRKVIVARPVGAGYDCSPDFNVRYRLFFLLFFLVFNSLMLEPLHNGVFCRSFIAGSTYAELQSAHLVFVMVNVSSAMLLNKRIALEYLGQVNMLALITILLILPLHFMNFFLPDVGNGFTQGYLALVALIVASEYIRRMKYAGIISRHAWVIIVNIISLTFFLTYLIL